MFDSLTSNYVIFVTILIAIWIMIAFESVNHDQFTFSRTTMPLNSSNTAFVGNMNSNNMSDPFYTENTKSTNTKVSSIDPIPTVEVTYIGNSTINGAPTQTIGTITDKMNKDGSVSSKGQAIILTALGQVLTYGSESIGTYNADGSFSDSGIMVFHMPFKMNPTNSTDTSSNTTDPLQTQFDNLFGIYKKTVDPDGNGLTKVWKWN